MKRVIYTLLCVCLVIALCGCEEKESGVQNDIPFPAESPVSSAEAPAATQAPTQPETEGAPAATAQTATATTEVHLQDVPTSVVETDSGCMKSNDAQIIAESAQSESLPTDERSDAPVEPFADRPETITETVMTEGIENTVTYTLVKGDGWSFYLSDNTWTSNGNNVWTGTYNEDVKLWIEAYPNQTANDIKQTLLDNGFDETLFKNEGSFMFAVPFDGFAFMYEIPAYSEYLEGWGTELAAMAQTFELGCVYTTQNTEETGTDSQSVLEAILNGTGIFYDIDFQKDVTISESCAVWGAYSGVTVSTPRFSAVDMDGDGVKELLFKVLINGVSDYGVKVIHYENGKANSFTFSDRQLMNIKDDGSFWISGSGDTNGAAKLSFRGDTYAYEAIETDQFDSKADLVWYEYPGSSYADILN